MTRNNGCNRDQLSQLLRQSLPVAVEQSLYAHVTGCEKCQHELESLAAHSDWWIEASQRLSRSALVDREFPLNDREQDDDDLAKFATDFAVDFLEPTDDTRMLGRLGEYEIVELIGKGGMGVVLKGYQKELQRYVAVKVLSPHLATSGAARRRFAREAQATAAVVHPHVMAIHSVQANVKLPYLVMPYLACQSLQDRLDEQGPLPIQDILRIGMQAALGLSAAHAQGLVHRDVKPANILLENNVDRVLLTDFGLARAVDDATLTRTGIIAGTPQYMSPEQANGENLDPRSDLFSLGSVLYALCTGRPPFRADTTFGVLRRIRETSPRSIREINPEIPEWFERIVLKLLEKEIHRRPDTAAEIADLLEHCLAHLQQPTSIALPEGLREWTRPEEQSAPRSGTRRKRVVVVSSLIGVVLAIAAGSIWVRAERRSSIETEPSPQTASAKTEPAVDTTPTISLTEREPTFLDWLDTERDLSDTATSIDELEEDVKALNVELKHQQPEIAE